MKNLLKNLDALLVTSPTNIRYLTGFVGTADKEREAYVLITPNKTFLFTNALYREKAKKLTSLKSLPAGKAGLNLLGTKDLTFMEVSREEPFEKKLAEVLKRSHLARPQGETLQDTLQGIRLGFEETELTVAEYHKIMLEHKNVRLVPTKDKIETLRMIKRENEIEDIRRAANLTDQCFDFILGKLKPGVSEKDIAWEIESFIRTHGASLAFSAIVAFGKNSSMPHYAQCQMSNAKCQMNDIILMDFGARVNEYCSDMTRVVFVGNPKDEWVKTYEAVFTAQQTVLNYLHLEGVKAHLPGGARLSGAQIDRIARDVIQKTGFPSYPHSLGHGVGLDIHEAPRLTIKKNTSLKPNMVVTVEPAIYMEGQYGIRIEDLVLLKSDGIEILSHSPKTLTVL